MQEEIGTHLRLGILLVMVGSLTCVVVTVLAFVLLNFGGFRDKYTTSMTTAVTGSIYGLMKEDRVTSPQVYSSIMEASDEIRAVYYSKEQDGSGNPIWDQIYSFDNSTEDKLVWLMSAAQTRVNVRVEVKRMSDGIPPYLEVYLTEEE